MTLRNPSQPPSVLPDTADAFPPSLPFQEALLILLVVMAGALFALNLMPAWLPALTYSTAGAAPKIYWFLSRGSAIAAYWILWLSMSSGVIITNKMAQKWPGIPPAFEIHQYTSLLGLAIGLFHALVLTGDRYIGYTIPQVLIPFAGTDYRPLWVGIGQVAFYVWGIVNFSFYIRKRIGKKAWRWIHFASFASFAGVLIHGLNAGTDATTQWAQGLYWFSGGVLLFLVVYRVLVWRFPPNAKAHRPAGANNPINNVDGS
jgi:predicted ferric reductase